MNKLVQAVAELLDNEYGYEVYTDELPMGFKSPSFFIEVINSQRSWVNGKRYKMQVFMNIYYFPNNTNSINKEILKVADGLYDQLDVFETNCRKYRGLNMSHNQNDDYLVFSLNVNYHIKIDDNKNKMETLQHTASTMERNFELK